MMQRALLGLGHLLFGMSLGVLLGLLIPHDPEEWGMFVIGPLVFWVGVSFLSLQLDFPRRKLLVLLLFFVSLNLASVFLFGITFSLWAAIASGLLFWAVKETLGFKTHFVFVAACLVMLSLSVLLFLFTREFAEFYLGKYDRYHYYPVGPMAALVRPLMIIWQVVCMGAFALQVHLERLHRLRLAAQTPAEGGEPEP
jgi:hypothetical protein